MEGRNIIAICAHRIPFLQCHSASMVDSIKADAASEEETWVCRVKHACAEYAKPNHGSLDPQVIARLESMDGWNWADGCTEFLAIQRIKASVCMWVNLQRIEYARSNHGRLSSWHIQKLQSFRGWNWGYHLGKQAKMSLADWIHTQREEYAKPTHGRLSKVEIRKNRGVSWVDVDGSICERVVGEVCTLK